MAFVAFFSIPIVGTIYVVSRPPQPISREPAGKFVSVIQNPTDFLSHQRFTVTTTTHVLTTLCGVSARRGARCEIVTKGDTTRWLVIDGYDGRCRVIP
jgi:hypothetical protein